MTSLPGKPMQNGSIESFNGRFRDECLVLYRHVGAKGELRADGSKRLRRKTIPTHVADQYIPG